MKLRKSENKELIKRAIKFQPWDYSYNLEIEKEMFKKMHEFYSSDKPVSMGYEKVARDAKLAINLLDILLENNKSYVGNFGPKGHKVVQVKYVNTRNASRFIKDVKFDNPYAIDALRVKKAWYLYSKLRYYKMKTWWD